VAQAVVERAALSARGGRALLSAWVPAGPIDAVLGAMGRIVGRIAEASRPRHLAWFDPAAVPALAAETGLVLESTTEGELDDPRHLARGLRRREAGAPMAVAVRPAVQQAGLEAEVRDAMTTVLRGQ